MKPNNSRCFSLASLVALVPLERSLEYGGDQISLYCGKEIGDLIIVTLNKCVSSSTSLQLTNKLQCS